MAEKILTFNGKTISGPNGTGMVVLKEPAPAHQVVIGGKTYRTVNMPDGKVWLAENLDFAWNGLSVPTEGASTSTDPQAMYYNYDESTYGWNGYKCGLLYNWFAVNYLEVHKSTLIPGWHVPTADEWAALADAVGGESTAGTTLKALDNSAGSNWPSSWNGTDDYGFSILPGGEYTGNFYEGGIYGCYYSVTESSSSNAYYRTFSTGISMGLSSSTKKRQRSVRLVQDSTSA